MAEASKRDWSDRPAGMQSIMSSSFRGTPPPAATRARYDCDCRHAHCTRSCVPFYARVVEDPCPECPATTTCADTLPRYPAAPFLPAARSLLCVVFLSLFLFCCACTRQTHQRLKAPRPALRNRKSPSAPLPRRPSPADASACAAPGPAPTPAAMQMHMLSGEAAQKTQPGDNKQTQ